LWLQKRFDIQNFFTPLFSSCFWILDPRSEIRDTGWVKIRIRDKHPGSATLVRIRDPRSGKTYSGSWIPDPGPGVKKAPDPGSRSATLFRPYIFSFSSCKHILSKPVDFSIEIRRFLRVDRSSLVCLGTTET
jgi:hypothetical protein